jgi:hypothetical protein
MCGTQTWVSGGGRIKMNFGDVAQGNRTQSRMQRTAGWFSDPTNVSN